MKQLLSPKPSAEKPGYSVGIEFDNQAVRALRLVRDGNGGQVIESMADVSGTFAEDNDLVDCLRQIRERLKMSPRDSLVTCISGKQISVTQTAFRRLPPEEMESALRLEMRKAIPFEMAGATLDYQVLEGADAKSETVQVLVAISGAGILSRQLKLLERAGLSPEAVDVLPMAACNALWSSVGTPKNDSPHVAVHIGPQISTIVIDGARSPFFNRYVYFAAEDFAGKDSSSPDLEKRTLALADEVARSLAFYEKSTFSTGFTEVLLLGDYLETPGLIPKLTRQTGLAARKMDLPKQMGFTHDHAPGRFDLAMALALRAGED